MRLRSRVAGLLASWFGCGFAPVAPGTVGALGAVPLHMALRRMGPVAHGAAVAGVSLAAARCAGEVARELGSEDPQVVVIDEVAGTLIAMGMVRQRSAATQLTALLLFRAFDIAKPGPVAAAERARPRGVGIVLDDVVAGAMAGLLTRWVLKS